MQTVREVLKHMKMAYQLTYLMILCLGLLAFAAAGPAFAEEANCSTCHEQLTTGKSVHPAVAMGCATCHSAIDPTDVPHAVTNKNPKGLVAKKKDLCFNCHDRAQFKKTTVHGALLLGCTTCHNPHATENVSILKEEMPGLCLSCHEEALKEKKEGVHPVAGNEECSVCHHPHASDSPKLVRTQQENTAKGETALIKKSSVAHQ